MSCRTRDWRCGNKQDVATRLLGIVDLELARQFDEVKAERMSNEHGISRTRNQSCGTSVNTNVVSQPIVAGNDAAKKTKRQRGRTSTASKNNKNCNIREQQICNIKE
ncbi:hypothetical protein ACFE04_021097 [Oxalis oulophora]